MDCGKARAVSAGSLGGDTDAMLRSLNAIIEVTRGPEGFFSREEGHGRLTWLAFICVHTMSCCLPHCVHLSPWHIPALTACGLDGESGSWAAGRWPAWAETVVWLWTLGFRRPGKCPAIKDGLGHGNSLEVQASHGILAGNPYGHLLFHSWVS